VLKSVGKYSDQQTLKGESKLQHVTETLTLSRKILVYSHGIMGSVLSGWKLERIADYGECVLERIADYRECGVGLEALTDSGLWGVWCRAGSSNG
jgi:hypothetical protein